MNPPIIFTQEGAWRVGHCQIPALDKAATVAEFQAACERDFASNMARYVALDLSGVGQMVSPAVGLVVSLFKRQRQSGGTLVICGLDPKVADIFKLAGLD